ncbi:LOW QUALITY PROTEIN: kinetochore-associated protein NSL1 homolog [Denticeps clupeoides]|uniref:LOW QUALITY PROTEIN: kinetochore-associated protein NSL1 homolog n=1 Tax=Denticeps clupeoides TaxID=299321 RepID=UPI0010A51712|nr:LOW QUALITY PROTEIN: kinetochore-associated protein NSL1 homolog [Denticeps clupeoides]
MAAAAADFRVEVRRKRAAAEQLSRYGAALAKLLDAQPGIGAGARETLRRELLSNFELAVQNNIVINGLSWEDAPEEDKPSEDERGILNDLLDEEIVQTTWKRRCYSKKILPHVVRALKSERKLMGLYEQAVRPEEMRTCPLQEGIKKNVSEAAPSVRRRAASLMKSLQVLQQRAEGLHQVLDTPPAAEPLQAYRDVFGPPGGRAAARSGLPITRAVAEAEYRGDFVTVAKMPGIASGSSAPQ